MMYLFCILVDNICFFKNFPYIFFKQGFFFRVVTYLSETFIYIIFLLLRNCFKIQKKGDTLE